MKTLLIGINPYIIFDVWGLDMKGNPDDFDIIMLYMDDSPIYNCPDLCRDAVLAQRRYDLYKLSKEVGLKKVTNLNAELINVEKVAIQLQLYMSLNGIKKVWYHYSIPSLFKVLIDKTSDRLGIEKTFTNKCSREEFNVLMVGRDKATYNTDYKDLISLSR